MTTSQQPEPTSATSIDSAADQPTKKPAAKKAATTKAAATKAPAKKESATKAPAKKAAAKKVAVDTAPATKATATKAPAKKAAAKAPAKKAAAKAPAKKAVAAAVVADQGAFGGLTPPPTLTGRFPVTDVSPTVEGGRRPAKAVERELIPVRATAFREGHDFLAVEAVLRDSAGLEVDRSRMAPEGVGLDQWVGHVRPLTTGDHSFTVEAWSDVWATWVHRAEIKVPADSDVELELESGARLLAGAAKTLSGAQAKVLTTAAAAVRNTELPALVRLAAATSPDVHAVLAEHPIREGVTVCGPWPLRVERRLAGVGSWYEFFPRSEGSDGHTSGTFRTAMDRLDAVAAMGFDVLYVPPIHPIGRAFRKGPNNTLVAGENDPGSPWAIGAAEGGHDTVHPDLGTIEDFDAFVAKAQWLGIEVALDLALQASPEHPWVAEHPDWFTTRPDGTIAYAENPPKKYQDIYPLNFDLDPEGLYAEILRVVRFWMGHGVRVFRVDNPHTKPLWLWDRLIGEINATDPDVIFLAEAFTRPPMMRALAEVGFQQSYSYFTWRNTRAELIEYVTHLSTTAAAYMRPNFFVNTPDILPEFLQTGSEAAFAIRATLGATLVPTWGVYAGFELFEGQAVRPGSEEYLDSEKYQFRPRDWENAHSLAPFITKLNHWRREHAALQDLRSIRFHHVDDERVIAYSKRDGNDLVLVVCLLDPFANVETTVWWDMPALEMDWHDRFIADDLVSGQTWTWGQRTYVHLDPSNVTHIVSVRQS